MEKKKTDKTSDILEGVDIIGTIIDKSLPELSEKLERIENKLSQIDERIDKLSGEELLGDDRQLNTTELLQLLDQRLNALEDKTSRYYENLSDELSDIKGKLETLKSAKTGDE